MVVVLNVVLVLVVVDDSSVLTVVNAVSVRSSLEVAEEVVE